MFKSDLDGNAIWALVEESLDYYTAFDSISFYYHTSTCETHTISVFHDEILAFIKDNPSSTTELISHHLAEICDESLTDAWRNKINNELMALADIELVQLVDPS